MMNVIFLGNNTTLIDRLKLVTSCQVLFATKYKDVMRVNKLATSATGDSECVILYEKHSLNEDITAITYLT